MQNAIRQLGAARVKELVAVHAREMHVPEILHIDYVCDACCNNLELAPDMIARSRTELSLEDCVKQWVTYFILGYNERISVHRSNRPGTVPDPAVAIIVAAGLRCCNKELIDQIVFTHRLSMSAENILGLLLEEFIFSKISPYGWALAWGETIKSVDFCNAEGLLLQVKNRSNSVNSSSSQVRNGRPIQKCFRGSATSGRSRWPLLQNIVGNQPGLNLSETEFQRFITITLDRNPDALAIEDRNPWPTIVEQNQQAVQNQN